ncbi:unnamed protein product [Amoebophrya sp. A25]|nr:unnamed protein product [Amoebophrya sp. A25]|eukprot:GSA25T00007029001.1
MAAAPGSGVVFSETYLDEVAEKSRNALLMRDAVGKAKASIYDIPSGIAFGLAPEADKEGAKEIVNVWKAHQASAQEKENRVNYLKWNKFVASQKAIKHPSVGKLKKEIGEDVDDAATLSDLDLARDDLARREMKIIKWKKDRRNVVAMPTADKEAVYHNYAKKDKTYLTKMEIAVSKASAAAYRSKSLSAANTNVTHGRRKVERPPTPMDMVIGMEFAKIGAKESRERYEHYKQLKKNEASVKQSGPTKASLGHATGALHAKRSGESATKAEWRLSRFMKVKPTMNMREYLAAGPRPGMTKSASSKDYI